MPRQARTFRPASSAIDRDLKSFKFADSTVACAFTQSTGMQNDRLTSYAFFDELAEALKAKSASVVKNSNGIREIVSAPLAGAFANSDGMGAITLSNQTVLFPRASSLPIMGTNVAEELLTGANRIAQGGE